MRESPFKTEISSGGRGGDAYGQMMDSLMIKKVVSPTGHLVQRFAGNMLRHAAAVEKAKHLLGEKEQQQGKENEHVNAIG
jgi:hypothetical protein